MKPINNQTVTLDDVDFWQKLDHVCSWMVNWEHLTICEMLEGILESCDYNTINSIRTILHPAMHRDLMYTAVSNGKKLVPISTTISREMKMKMKRFGGRQYWRRLDDGCQDSLKPIKFTRVKSAHITSLAGFKELVNEVRSADGNVMESLYTYSPISLVKERPNVGFYNAPAMEKNQCNERQHRNFNSLTSESSWLNHTALSNRPGLCRSKSEIPFKVDHSSQKINGKERVSSLSISTVPTCFINSRSREVCGNSKLVDYLEENVNFRKWSKSSTTDRNLKKLSSAPASLRTDLNDDLRNSQSSEKGRNKTVRSTNDSITDQNICAERLKTVMNWFHYWNSTERLHFLRTLLSGLDLPELYHVSALLTVKHRLDILAMIPLSASLKILALLLPKQILVSSAVSKSWNKLCMDNMLWKMKCEETQIYLPVMERETVWINLYKKSQMVDAFWRSNQPISINCTIHDGKITAIAFDDSRIATGGSDRTIRVWDLCSKRCVQVLKGHERGIWCLLFYSDRMLISGSYDATIKIWNLLEGISTRTLSSHSGPIWTLKVQKNYVVSASKDKLVKLWNIDNFSLVKTYQGHKGAVFCADLNDSITVVVTGSADRTVRLWEAMSGICLKIISINQKGSITSLCYQNPYIVFTCENVIYVYDEDEGQGQGLFIRKYREHTKRVESMKMQKESNEVISISKDGVFKSWNLAEKDSIQTFACTKTWISCVTFHRSKAAMANQDNHVRILNSDITSSHEDESNKS